MDAFARLSPAMQYQIVNSLGFRSLRPVQELATNAILDGANCVVLAPTAGGKTESALFPVLSAMDSEGWEPVSALYIAPIRALLNNQDARLERYTRMIGRRSFTWHGDVPATAKKRFVREPTDLLLTTPESIEVMLVSQRVPARRLFRGLRAVIIDEVHAFVGDDRGGHMASLLERLSRICGRDLQRIGLSATVGNPEEILRWMQGSSQREGRVIRGPGSSKQAEVTLDFVGSRANAAQVISMLDRGRKRLVFTEGRAFAEEITLRLRELGVQTFVSHSSLALDERQRAEEAFAQGSDCVIVATSALELGIDVGDLDRVYQIDAPTSVASFLQRMGRTGRREGAVPNCTFLTTNRESCWSVAAILRLWDRGYIEPLRPPAAAAHLLAHQIMAMTLQEGGIASSDWWAWVSSAAPFRGLSADDRAALLDHMIEQDILQLDGGRVLLSRRGEQLYGYRHFAELYSVFATSRTLTAVHAGVPIGTLDARWIEGVLDRDVNFTLAGRRWRLSNVDWQRGEANVVPGERTAVAVWLGDPKIVDRMQCAEQRRIVSENTVDSRWTPRATQQIEALRLEFAGVTTEGPLMIQNEERLRVLTFAGWHGNALLAGMWLARTGERPSFNNSTLNILAVSADRGEQVWSWLSELREQGRPNAQDALDASVLFGTDRLSKFQPCLPPMLVKKLIADTHFSIPAARDAIAE